MVIERGPGEEGLGGEDEVQDMMLDVRGGVGEGHWGRGGRPGSWGWGSEYGVSVELG